MSQTKQLTLHSFMKKSNRNSTKIDGKAAVTVTDIQVGWLIEAVKRVKAQKQRPDRERICHFIQQHHDVTSETVSLLLDSAVKSNILTTTITRGNTDKLTYVITSPLPPPPPTSPATQKSAESAPPVASNADSVSETISKIVLLHNKSDISPLMVKAVKALREPSGSSLNDIAEYILTACNVELKNGVDLIRLVKLSARQAVRNDMLIKNKDNLYKVPRGQRGRPKNDSPPSKKGPTKAKPIPICCFCLGDEKKNRSKEPEDMVSCCRCGQSGHPSCLKFSESQTKVVLGMDDWECYDCKKCAVCKISKRNDNDMLICDRCDRSFHPHCCRPPVKKPPDGTWICHLCINGHDGKWKTLPSDKKVDLSSPSTSNGKVKFGLKRKRYEYKSHCFTPDCDGRGNSNPSMSNHRLQSACPLLSKAERRKFRQQKESGSESNEECKAGSVDDLDGSSMTEPTLLKGLQDGLSQFFTPTDKRTSRVSMSSLLTAAAAATTQPVKQPKSAATTSQAAANKLLKKSKLVQQSKVKAIHKALNNNNSNKTENQHGSSASSSSTTFSLTEHMHSLQSVSQLKGLVDGMTRFFTPTGERKKSTPVYVTAAPVRKRKDTDKSGTQSGAEDSDGMGLFSDSGEKSDGNIVDSIDKTHLPAGVSFRDYRLFRNSQTEAKEPGSVGLLVKPVIEPGKRYPPTIEFGKYELQTWYSSPYPQEYAQLPKLYICEFCLKYMKSKSILKRHMDKCGFTNPPANEIYCKDDLSVFEVDGNINKIYCQNLCLLAKLFLDHKTLYYDVEPFLFYVLTINDTDGCHFVGYFSKEKHCQQKYNVSCITTLPQHQRKGYGKFLIDFSYMLSRIEGVPGSPEKPLSELGKISYRSYWKCTLLRYLHHHKHDSSLTIKGISSDTGMCPHDIASTLQELHMIDTNTADDVIILLNSQLIASHITNLKSADSTRLVIDEECVRWTPVISSHTLSSPEKSSSPDKASVVSLLRERRLTIDADIEVEPEPVKSPPPRQRRVSLTKDRNRKVSARNSASARSTSPPPSSTVGESKHVTRELSPPTPTRDDFPSSKLRSRGAVKPVKPAAAKPTDSNGPTTLTNGVLPVSSRRRQSQVSSSDEDDDAVPKPKPHPPKKRRASCKDDKVSRRKSGSPSTPEKKNRFSSTRSNASRRASRQQSAAGNSQRTKSSSSADDRRNGRTVSGGGEGVPGDSYLSDGASSVDSGGAPCYDASASDTDSGNSEMELSSNASAVWSPTIQHVYSDSGSVTEGRSSRLDQFLQDTGQQVTPQKEKLGTSSVVLQGPTRGQEVSTPVEDSSQKDQQAQHLQTMGKTNMVKNQLPVPQSYPPNTGPEIDPATLCFESPISLSSNDTSLNGSQPIDSTQQYIDQHVATPVENTQTYNSYNEYDNAVHTSLNNSQYDQQQPSAGDSSSRQQAAINNFVNNIPSISTEQSPQCEFQVQQMQSCYSNVAVTTDQHSSPQNLQHVATGAPMFPPQSPLTLIPNSPHLAPQSPQVPQKSPLIHPHSPHIPPQSPHVHPQSPHMHPQSPHMPSQTPHFTHTGPILSPGHQQTPYSYRARTGSMSRMTPPDLTPPPGTPSPSKQHPSPDRYQQYLQQSRVPQKSPNVTISGRDLQQYNGGSSCALPPAAIHQHMQNLSNNPGGYQMHHHQQTVNTQHFFPSNQYVDPRYFNQFNSMQLAQAAAAAGQPSGVYGGQLPATNTAGIYSSYR